MMRSAYISKCGLYRYSLTRIWACTGNLLVFVMLNPSTADAETDDPTIRRCINFAKRDGYAGIKVINLNPYRSTDPSALFYHRISTEAMDENYLETHMVMGSNLIWNSPIVFAWGAHEYGQIFGQDYIDHAHCVRGQMGFKREDRPFYCLGRTAKGAPRHPLYVKASQPLEVYA